MDAHTVESRKIQHIRILMFRSSKSSLFNAKMKIFKIIQRHYAILGIFPSSNQSPKTWSFNKRVLIGFSLFGCLIISKFLYIFRGDTGFIEYMDGICTTLLSILSFLCFAIIVFRRATLFEGIDNIEKLIETSKYKNTN